MFSRLRIQVTVTAASAACMIVAVVSAGAAIYAALRLVFEPFAAAGLTAVVFFGLAVAGMLILKEEEAHQAEPPTAKGSKLNRWASLAGEVAGAFAAGAIGAPGRRTDRR